MNAKKFSFVLLLPALFILSGCGPAPTGAPGTTPGATVNQEESLNSTPLEIMRSGKSLTCTWTSKDVTQGVETTGQYYVDGQKGKFRMDGEATVQGTKAKTFMIGDKEFVYSWSDIGGSVGFKMAVPKNTPAGQTGSAQQDQSIDPQADFKCLPWTVDDSKFVLPTNVNFMDFGAIK